MVKADWPNRKPDPHRQVAPAPLSPKSDLLQLIKIHSMAIHSREALRDSGLEAQDSRLSYSRGPCLNYATQCKKMDMAFAPLGTSAGGLRRVRRQGVSVMFYISMHTARRPSLCLLKFTPGLEASSLSNMYGHL